MQPTLSIAEQLERERKLDGPRRAPASCSRKLAKAFTPSFGSPVEFSKLREVCRAVVTVDYTPDARREFPRLCEALGLQIGVVETEYGLRLKRSAERVYDRPALSKRELKRRMKAAAGRGEALRCVGRKAPDQIDYVVRGLADAIFALSRLPWVAHVTYGHDAGGRAVSGNFVPGADGTDSNGTAVAMPEPPRPAPPPDIRNKRQAARRDRVRGEVEQRPMTVGLRPDIAATEAFVAGTTPAREPTWYGPQRESNPAPDAQHTVAFAAENAEVVRPEAPAPDGRTSRIPARRPKRGRAERSTREYRSPQWWDAYREVSLGYTYADRYSDRAGVAPTVQPADTSELPFAPGAYSAYPRQA